MEARLKGSGLMPFVNGGRPLPSLGWASAPFNLRQGTVDDCLFVQFTSFLGTLVYMSFVKNRDHIFSRQKSG